MTYKDSRYNVWLPTSVSVGTGQNSIESGAGEGKEGTERREVCY